MITRYVVQFTRVYFRFSSRNRLRLFHAYPASISPGIKGLVAHGIAVLLRVVESEVFAAHQYFHDRQFPGSQNNFSHHPSTT
jgi:hypothetical protein